MVTVSSKSALPHSKTLLINPRGAENAVPVCGDTGERPGLWRSLLKSREDEKQGRFPLQKSEGRDRVPVLGLSLALGSAPGYVTDVPKDQALLPKLIPAQMLCPLGNKLS